MKNIGKKIRPVIISRFNIYNEPYIAYIDREAAGKGNKGYYGYSDAISARCFDYYRLRVKCIEITLILRPVGTKLYNIFIKRFWNLKPNFRKVYFSYPNLFNFYS